MEDKDSKRSKQAISIVENQFADIKIIDLEELRRMLKVEEKL